jgi:hypothetical protein
MTDGMYQYHPATISMTMYGIRFDYPKPAVSLLIDLDDGRRASLTYMEPEEQIVMFGILHTTRLHQIRNKSVMLATHGHTIVGITAVIDINRIAYSTKGYTRWEDLKTSWRQH